MDYTEQRVIATTGCKGYEEEKHLLFVQDDKTFCGCKIGVEDINRLPDYKDVLNDSASICDDCVEEHRKWSSNGGKRSPTVKCKCDVMTKGSLETCKTVVSAYRARELSHPQSDTNIPVCPNCYRWLRSLSSNGVETSYKEAQSWTRRKNIAD